MDLEEWEFLSEDGFIDQLSTPRRRRHHHQHHHKDCGGGSRRVIPRENLPFHQGSSIIDMDYFQKFIDPQSSKDREKNKKKNGDPNNQIVPIPVQFHHPEIVSAVDDGDEPAVVVKEVISSDQETHRHHLLLQRTPSSPSKEGTGGSEEEVISQVFFKKMGENEFADMKLDSPKSTNRGGLVVSPFDLAGKPRFEEKEGGGGGGFDSDSAERNGKGSPRAAAVVVDGDGGFVVGGFKDKSFTDPDEEWESDDGSNSNGGGGGLSIWKMGMTGIGALCSFGFACATICIIVLGSRSREKQHGRYHHQQEQKLRFQIYTDDMRINQVVHHAAMLNEAISAVRGGAHSNRAEITIGGYFEGF